MNIFVARSAERDIARIDAWWKQERPAAPDLFAEELAGAFSLLEVAPDVGRFFVRRPSGDVRRLLLPESRYHVYYRRRPADDTLVVVRVWSAVRGQPPRL